MVMEIERGAGGMGGGGWLADGVLTREAISYLLSLPCSSTVVAKTTPIFL